MGTYCILLLLVTLDGLLIAKGVNTNHTVTVFFGYTPLMIATTNGHPRIVEKLLSVPSTRLDIADHILGWSALHCTQHVSCISLLVKDRRCSPDILNMKNNRGLSPIMMAVKWGHLESVKCLAGVPGVDLGTRDKEGNTLIDMARKWSVMAFLSSLLLERKWPFNRGEIEEFLQSVC